jgi:PadR family transcriptional regulator PadR
MGCGSVQVSAGIVRQAKNKEYGEDMKLFSKICILEACILAMLSRGDVYGYEMARSNALEISESTLYPILRRLCECGCLESYSQTHDAKLRKFYRITLHGHERLEQLKVAWEEFKDAINSFLAENMEG